MVCAGSRSTLRANRLNDVVSSHAKYLGTYDGQLQHEKLQLAGRNLARGKRVNDKPTVHA